MDLPYPINQTAATTAFITASAAASPSTSRLLIPPVSIQPRPQPPVSIQPRPTTVYPITGQLDTGPITTVHPIVEQLDCGSTVRPIMEQLNFGPIDIPCNSCAALYWINKCVSTLHPSDPRFEACCKHSNINLSLFQPLLKYLYNLLEFCNTSARLFRERLRAYNAALAFTSVNYTVTDYSIAYNGPNCF